MLLLLRLVMASVLSRRWAGGDGGVGSVRLAGLLLLHVAAAGVTTAASLTEAVPDSSFTLSLRRVVM